MAAERSAETFTQLMDHVAQGFEALGAGHPGGERVIWAVVLGITAVRRSGWSAWAYLVVRQTFGGTLLLGLEVLVAADLLRTVAVAPSLDNVLVLGLIVVIRTFLEQLLAGNRDRGRCAVAAGDDGRRGDDPPRLSQRAGAASAPRLDRSGDGTASPGQQVKPEEQLMKASCQNLPRLAADRRQEPCGWYLTFCSSASPSLLSLSRLPPSSCC